MNGGCNFVIFFIIIQPSLRKSTSHRTPIIIILRLVLCFYKLFKCQKYAMISSSSVTMATCHQAVTGLQRSGRPAFMTQLEKRCRPQGESTQRIHTVCESEQIWSHKIHTIGLDQMNHGLCQQTFERKRFKSFIYSC